MNMPLIDENHYADAMRETVLPALAKCRVEGWMAPAGVDDEDLADGGSANGGNGASAGGAGGRHRDLDSRNDLDDAGDNSSGSYHPSPSNLFDISALPAPPAPGKLHYVCFDAHKFDELNIDGASAKFRGAIVFSHGFTEFAEKHAEMTWYFLLAGYSVCILEHRGHGYSVRDVANPSLVWIDDWRRYVADLAKFAQGIGRIYADGQPLYLYAHSMGGGIGAAALECFPTLFDRAVLSSPMIEPVTGMPNAIAGPATALASAIGLSRHCAPGQVEFSPTMKLKGYNGAEQSRVQWYFALRKANTHYQTNAATFGWVHQALKMSKAALDRGACARIETPILLFQAGRDTWVHNSAQNRFVERVRVESGDVVLERVEPAVHEIFSMPNAILGPYVDRIIDFYGETIDEMVADEE
ncbi:alpha/beta hydrolase [Bifidobacterium sp. ESL0790]|uniref:alpha/beta fold hydrolase n=1 Tax=Bifidobacterium sp. ESL0790 TaxID=2983233 RepID=UPI0023FA378A|nr:alpha/beta hydrolase [Bifidobacterium sp. ESL0790]WEV72406.1 alpha/beta hydrolase [Bifidobacterium sp. ESL0790]